MAYYVLAFLALVLYFLTTQALSFRRNLRAAQRSGITYTLSPIYGYSPVWLLISSFLLPLLRRLPTFITRSWIHVIGNDWAWDTRFAAFTPKSSGGLGLGKDGEGCETFLIVSSGGMILITAEASCINQISARRNDFPKPIEIYGTLDVFGKNVVSVEGGEWRRQRRLLTPQFNDKGNAVVWRESLFQAQEMLRSWTDPPSAPVKEGVKSGVVGVAKETGERGSKLVSGLSKDAMRLSLHVISRAGFDVRCLWPGASDVEGEQEGSISSTVVPEGHEMSYTESLETLLHRILMVLILPGWFMKYSPVKLLRTARQSYIEWGLYMQEVYTRKANYIVKTTAASSKGATDEGLDLMGAMIRQSGLIPGTPNHGKEGVGLTQTEVMGNSFVLFLAGHETAANSIHFCVLFLAMRPELQRKFQAELDEIFSDRPQSTWSYDTDVPRLFSTLAGAIMNEELRLVPPVINIPKRTLKDSPQPLIVNGKQCLVPADTYISLNSVGVHRNPKYWPHGPPRSEKDGGPIHSLSNLDNDLEEFKPERWLVSEDKTPSTTATTSQPSSFSPSEKISGSSSSTNEAKNKKDEDFEIEDAKSTLYQPPRGAYIPFSEGARSCIGRRFAQVEILATLAVIFKTHSVELAVDAYASPEEVQRMSEVEKVGVWGRAKAEAERKMREEMGTIITIQLRGQGIKIRVCERGAEVFG